MNSSFELILDVQKERLQFSNTPAQIRTTVVNVGNMQKLRSEDVAREVTCILLMNKFGLGEQKM